MSVRYKKSYRFAFKSTALITIFAVILLSALEYFFDTFHLWFTLAFAVLFFVFCFVVLQFRVEHFIYRRIQKLYKQLSLLDKTELRNQPVTTDMKTLISELKTFARKKKVEVDTLKIQEEYRREFIGNVAHELKTPLFTVQGYLETLLDKNIKLDKSLKKKYLKRAENGVERLIDVVESLDMITKLETNELHLNKTHFDIVAVFQRVFDLLELKADEKDIVCIFDKDHYRKIFVYGDEEKIYRVAINLIENSIKYGRNNGTTEVGFEEVTDNKLLIRITDDGKGIEQKHLPRLFERFYRTDTSRQRKIGGSGLGLSIVKHIIEAHNEHIHVESELEKGSTFSFTLQKGEEAQNDAWCLPKEKFVDFDNIINFSTEHL